MSRAFERSYADDDDSVIFVMVEERSAGSKPDDQSLPVDHLELSVTWNVKRVYYAENDLSKKWPIRDHNELHVFDGMLLQKYYSFLNILRTMTFHHMICEKIPFPLVGHRLRWKDGFSGSTSTTEEAKLTPLASVDDMILKICDVLNGMVLSGRKKLDILITIDKQSTVAPHQYEAIARATNNSIN